VIGLIGGYNIENILSEKKWRVIKTKHGLPSSKVAFGDIFNKKIAIICRHGEKHSIPPHRINNKANIQAFYDLGVKQIICTAAVGIINPKIKLGNFILPNDFIDFTFQPTTFFDASNCKTKHIFMGNPYSPRLCSAIAATAKKLKLKIHNRGVYANMPGPRLETQAELKMLKKLGADMVGMTNTPEIILANELNLEIATIALGVNYTIGIPEDDINMKKIVQEKKQQLRNLIIETIKII
jgi:5'-methylthioadenosine phosphorylase